LVVVHCKMYKMYPVFGTTLNSEHYIYLTFIIYYYLAERETGKRGNRLIRPERPLPKPGAPAEAESSLGRPSSSHWRRRGGLSSSVADPSHFDTVRIRINEFVPLTNGSGPCYFP
jgi:hypothetical protein